MVTVKGNIKMLNIRKGLLAIVNPPDQHSDLPYQFNNIIICVCIMLETKPLCGYCGPQHRQRLSVFNQTTYNGMPTDITIIQGG